QAHVALEISPDNRTEDPSPELKSLSFDEVLPMRRPKGCSRFCERPKKNGGSMRSLYVFLALTPLLAKDPEPVRRGEEEAAVFSESIATADKGIHEVLFENADCIVILPGLKKGAFIVGGEYGKGYLSCRKENGESWSAPGTVRIEGGSVGLQI